MKFVLACAVLALAAPVPGLGITDTGLRIRDTGLGMRDEGFSRSTPPAPRSSQIADRDKGEARNHYERGEEALHSEKYDEAEREFQASIKLDPTFELPRYGLGQTYMAMKRYQDAVVAFQKCRDVVHANNVADASDEVARNRRIDDMIVNLEDQKRLYQQPGRNSNTPLARNYLYDLDAHLSELRDARQKHPMGEEPTPAWLSLALGSAYFRTDALPDAEREYKNAVTVNPKLGEAHNNLAVVYLMTNRPSDASAELSAAEKAGFKVNAQLKEDVKNALMKKR